MGKVLNFLKKHSLGAHKTGLYANDGISFGSILSVIVSAIFLLGISVGIAIYFNEIFIQQKVYLTKQEIIELNKDSISLIKLPQALEIFDKAGLFVSVPGKVNDTFCSNISLHFNLTDTIYKVNFINYQGQGCLVSLYQNDLIKEIFGNATEVGFNFFGYFYRVNLDIRIYGLDKNMIIEIVYLSQQILSNGELAKQSFAQKIGIFNGKLVLDLNMFQYNRTASIFEQLFSRIETSYFLDVNSLILQQYNSNTQNFLEIYQRINPTVQSYQVQPKQFYEIFPLIGGLLGLLKLFSFVSIYNKKRFEKQLEESLAELKTKEEEGITQQSLNQFDDFSVNKQSTEQLIQIEPEVYDNDTKLKFNEFYSFATFKELYKNVKLLMTRNQSKEFHLNQLQTTINHLQTQAERHETQGNESNQKLKTVFEKLEQEICELRHQKDQLSNKNSILEKQISELRTMNDYQNSIHQEQIKQIMLKVNKIQDQFSTNQEFQKKND